MDGRITCPPYGPGTKTDARAGSSRGRESPRQIVEPLRDERHDAPVGGLGVRRGEHHEVLPVGRHVVVREGVASDRDAGYSAAEGAGEQPCGLAGAEAVADRVVRRSSSPEPSARLR